MHSVKSIAGIKLLLLFIIFSTDLQAQDNSPYTRFGLGTMVPRQNIVNRGMGGVSAAYADYQSINFINPAAIGYINSTTFDIGGEIDRRTLKSNLTPEKYSSTNTTISYLQFGVPVATKKMIEKKTSWGISFGIRPVTRIGYKIQEDQRLPGIDSVQTIYEGSGGVNQASLTTALKINRFSVGVTVGYNFGNKEYSSRRIFMNDSVIYYRSNTEKVTTFNSLSLGGGVQYEIPSPKGTWRIGAFGTLSQEMKGIQRSLNETFAYDGNGGTFTIDTVEFKDGFRGTIDYPLNYGFGFMYSTKGNNWTFGADYESTSWADYKFYGTSEGLINSYSIRAGAQFYPAVSSTLASKYFRFVKYRVGLFYGVDPIKLNEERKEFGVTAGAGFPLTSFQRIRFGEYAVLNTALEYGGTGNKNSGSVRENVMRFSLGISMNAKWFQKRKYD